MILVDTNVLSESTKQRPDLAVSAWLDRQLAEDLYLPAISLAEVLNGIELLPFGRRKGELSAKFDALAKRLFQNRILTFDYQAAIAYSKVVSGAQRKGYAISFPDGQIAAIAAVHGFTVATRDTAPFLAAGVPVLNPWQE